MNFLADTNVKIQYKNHLVHNFRKYGKFNFEGKFGALEAVVHALYNLFRKGEMDWNVQRTLDLVTDFPTKKLSLNLIRGRP